jgi:divalent metal cation (Fe/Co/Zn/Cd) transporter
MLERQQVLRRGRQLEYVTILWNSLEALVAVVAGLISGSIALVGFGLDSLIEVISAAALLWRLHRDHDRRRREEAERAALGIVGCCFLLLAGYIAVEALSSLLANKAAERSGTGIILAAVSLVVMPILSKAKQMVSGGLGSAAMAADSRQADFCAYLSAILLGGLLLNAALGLWWADAVAALVMVPIIAKEGISGWRGRACCDTCHPPGRA